MINYLCKINWNINECREPWGYDHPTKIQLLKYERDNPKEEQQHDDLIIYNHKV